MKRFTVRLALLYVLLGALCALLFSLWFADFYSSTLPFLFLFFYAISIVAFGISIGLSKASHAKFYRIYSLVTTVKLLVSLIFFVVIIAFNRDKLITLSIAFFLLYGTSLLLATREFNSHMSKITKK